MTLWKSIGHGDLTLEGLRVGEREVISLLGSLILSEGGKGVLALRGNPSSSFSAVKSRSRDPVAGEKELLR